VEIGLCKGKQDEDKRNTLRRKDADKETRRAMARF
jgi:tmRNA-binding protein